MNQAKESEEGDCLKETPLNVHNTEKIPFHWKAFASVYHTGEVRDIAFLEENSEAGHLSLSRSLPKSYSCKINHHLYSLHATAKSVTQTLLISSNATKAVHSFSFNG